MCMEDVRLGRETGHGVYTVTVPNGQAVEVCGRDPQRYSLTIAVGANTPGNAAPSDLTPSATAGIRINNTLPPIIRTIQDHGSDVTDRWRVYADGADVVVTVIVDTLGRV